MSNLTITTKVTPRIRFWGLQSRYWLLVGALAGTVLSLLVVCQATYTYDLSYRYFQNVALDSKAKIEDSDAALQSIAQVSTDVVDYFITTSTAQNTDPAQAANKDFDQFRRDIFKVNSNLGTGPETAAFYTAERAVYDEFWPHLTAALAAKTRGDSKSVVQEFSSADDILETLVIPNLTNVE